MASRIWLDNPPKRKRRKAAKRRKRTVGSTMRSVTYHGKSVSRGKWKSSGYRRNPKRRRKLAGAALAAHQRRIGKVHRKTRRNPVAKRRTAHRGHAVRRRRSNPHRRVARRRYRRNPTFGVKGALNMVTRGIKDAAFVVVGKGAARALPQLVGLNQTGPLGLGIQALAAVAAGFAANKFMGADAARFIVAGGLSAPIESFIWGLNIPVLSPALGGVDAYPGMAYVGAYPLEAYPEPGSIGESLPSMGFLDSGGSY